MALRGRSDADSFVEAFGASDRYIFDHLTDETLASQAPDVRSFLEATSILDRMTGPYCDALTGRSDGTSMLAALTAANVFVSPLDERSSWYRYRPLFAELVASSLSDERRTELHRAAAAWLAETNWRRRPSAIAWRRASQTRQRA